MRIIEIDIKEQKLTIKAPFEIVSGSVGRYGVQIKYDEEWETVNHKLLMVNGHVIKKIEDTGGVLELPWECIEKPCFLRFGVLGLDGTGNTKFTVYSEDELTVLKKEWNGGSEADETKAPTPTIWETLKKDVEDLKNNSGGNNSGESVAVDAELSETSENPVQNKIITKELKRKSNVIVNTASGENIVVNDSANERPIGMKLFGKSEQTQYGGNQLLPYPFNETTKTVNGVTFTDEGDGWIGVSGTSTGSASFVFGTEIALSINSGDDVTVKKEVSGTMNDVVISGWASSWGNFFDSKALLLGSNYEQSGKISSNVVRMQISIDNAGVNLNGKIRVMLNKGTTALPYEPYTGGIPSPNPQYPQEIETVGIDGSVEVKVDSQSIIFDTPNGLRGIKVNDSTLANYTDSNGNMWCCDEIDLKRGKYIQRVAKVTMDSNSRISDMAEWVENKANVTNFRFNPQIDLKRYGKGISTHFRFDDGVWKNDIVGCYSLERGVIDFTMPYSVLGITNNSSYTERVEALRAWLVNNPVEFCFQLETPIETDLSDMQLPTMNYPVTTILSDAHIEVDYVADTKNYIDCKFMELAKAML